MYIVSK